MRTDGVCSQAIPALSLVESPLAECAHDQKQHHQPPVLRGFHPPRTFAITYESRAAADPVPSSIIRIGFTARSIISSHISRPSLTLHWNRAVDMRIVRNPCFEQCKRGCENDWRNEEAYDAKSDEASDDPGENEQEG